LKARRNPLWRKILIVIFLPFIIIIWTIGWGLTQMGSNGETTKIKEKNFRNFPELYVNSKETKTSEENNEESRSLYGKKIIA
jgi:hypothetical protein